MKRDNTAGELEYQPNVNNKRLVQLISGGKFSMVLVLLANNVLEIVKNPELLINISNNVKFTC